MALYDEVPEDHMILRTGYTWTATWNSTDENGEVPPGYWDGWYAAMQLRVSVTTAVAGGGALVATLASEGAPIVDKDGDIILEDDGNIIATLPDEFTAGITVPQGRRIVYDLKLTSPTGEEYAVVDGTITIKKGVTE